MTAFSCPHCGADVPRGALACPECGSDDRSGWSEDADTWAGDIPTGYDVDEDFDYEEALRSEGLHPESGLSRGQRVHRVRTVVIALLILSLLLWLMSR